MGIAQATVASNTSLVKTSSVLALVNDFYSYYFDNGGSLSGLFWYEFTFN